MNFTHSVLSVIMFACIAAVDGAKIPAACVSSATAPTAEQLAAYATALVAAGTDQTKIKAACDDSDGYKNIRLELRCDGIDISVTTACVPDGCKESEYVAYFTDLNSGQGKCTVNSSFSRMSIIGAWPIILAGVAVLM
eukprot:CAMPEP_0198263770 /NCGR_PEP_ID=MMETSP1447-20131203/13786_1 /TAXON_ID=420782 /ORGANISM="Chaetoceros dichaeta, Strain CCMP1751" /LENGTH=137 /DNA_ID=CAMNT_0043952503 /DNA_START=51 /DNA_END=464 /DNA_ORIENTATION=-